MRPDGRLARECRNFPNARARELPQESPATTETMCARARRRAHIPKSPNKTEVSQGLQKKTCARGLADST
eukprot:7113264-Pyramimonas_sp.AAC.1